PRVVAPTEPRPVEGEVAVQVHPVRVAAGVPGQAAGGDHRAPANGRRRRAGLTTGTSHRSMPVSGRPSRMLEGMKRVRGSLPCIVDMTTTMLRDFGSPTR